MKVEVTQEYVRNNYPSAYEQILEAKKKSKSKAKGTPLDQCQWWAEWCVEFKGGAFSISDLLSGAPREEPEQIIHANFSASSGQGHWQSEVVEGTPSVIQEVIDHYEEEERKEQERIDNLTPEENRAEVEDLLRQLGRSPGFFAAQIPQEGDKE